MITGIEESKILIKYILYNFKFKSDCRKCNSKRKYNNNKCQQNCKKLIKHHLSKKYYTWNSNICAFECDKNYEIANICTCRKSIIDDFIKMNGEILDTTETVSINSVNEKKNKKQKKKHVK